MCGRFALQKPTDVLRLLFGLEGSPEWPSRFNIAPTQAILAVRPGAGEDIGELNTGPTSICLLRWGLIPGWSKDPSIASSLINARAETIAFKPSFRAAYQRRRCLIPVSGFYEWKKIGAAKQPYKITMADGAPFALAGIWERWQGADGSDVDTCSIITCVANDDVAHLHGRMPVILNAPDYEPWMREAGRAASKFLRPFKGPVPLVTAPVSLKVNNVRNDGEDVWQRAPSIIADKDNQLPLL